MKVEETVEVEDPTIALLRSWREEDARMTPAEALEAERDLDELLAALDRSSRVGNQGSRRTS